MSGLDRRHFLSGTVLALGHVAMGHHCAESQAAQESLVWHNVSSWGVEGKGWSDTERCYDRLPARAKGKVRDAVWTLSRHSAGMLVRFETDAASIHVRYSLLSSSLALPHMPATGVSGVDLYARDEDGKDRWLGVAFPTAQQVNVRLASGIDARPGGRLYTAYLPLYNGTETLEIGIPAGASFRPVAPRQEKPIVFYGTSIMHGACASRPGMSITAILGRRLNRPMINLGFSGNGRMEPEVGAFLTELDPALYCIDCLPNMVAKDVAEKTEPLIRQLRAARPDTPILLVEDRTYTNARFLKTSRDRHDGSRAALREAYKKLKAEGVKRLGYLEGDIQLGKDGEAATDGSHPNDLGMMRYADAYEPAIRRMLRG